MVVPSTINLSRPQISKWAGNDVRITKAIEDLLLQAGVVVTLGPNFSTRAASITWQASSVGGSATDGTVITAGGLQYFKSTGAVAITDMPNWLPSGDVSVAHFGAVGVLSKSAAALTFNAVTVTVNEAAVLQAAMDYCLSSGLDLSGDPSRVYGISSAIVWGARTASGTGSVVKGAPTLRNLFLKVIGGTWTGAVRPDADDISGWTWGPAALTIGCTAAANALGKFQVNATNVMLDGNRLGAGGIWFRAATYGVFDACAAVQCTDYQVRIGSQSASTDCTDASFLNLWGHEWTYIASGTGFNDISLRTAAGLLLQGSDSPLFSCTFAGSLYTLVVDGGYNSFMTGCKFWAGPTRTSAASRTIWISTRAGGYSLSNCRIDDGAAFVEMFIGRFVGCRFIQYTAGVNLQLRATVAGEQAATFIFANCQVANDIQAALLTKGAGSWGYVLAKSTGSIGLMSSTPTDYSIDGIFGPLVTQYVNNAAVFRSSKAITLQADWDQNSSGVGNAVNIQNRATIYHTFDQNGYRMFGVGQAPGGGNIMLEAFGPAGQYFIEPANSAGTSTDYPARIQYDPATAMWGFYTGLEMVSTTKGFGLPSMTSTQRDAMTGVRSGWVIYNTTVLGMQVRVGGSWVTLGSGGSSTPASPLLRWLA